MILSGTCRANGCKLAQKILHGQEGYHKQGIHERELFQELETCSCQLGGEQQESVSIKHAVIRTLPKCGKHVPCHTSCIIGTFSFKLSSEWKLCQSVDGLVTVQVDDII